MARSTRKSTGKTKTGKAGKLGKAVLALAATTLVEKAVRKGMQSPKLRRKARGLAKSAGKRLKKLTSR